MLVVGSSAMAMHYKTILGTFLFCPVPLAFSEKSGTGRTSSIIIGLGPTGAYPSRFISHASYKKYSELCATSFLPLGIDDPKSKVSISNLVLSLFNGAKEAIIKHGEQNHSSVAVRSANFTPVNQEKYLSRCRLIEFFEPSLDISMMNYVELPNLIEKSNSTVGDFIGLGFKFLDVVGI
uniref:Uncharacterized protein n=1 Tax=Amphimedon queenslandica TaxID=400682 RepID=A0A1X7TYB4_AMPQE